MIDVGAYGALPGLPLDTFKTVANQAQDSAQKAAGDAYKTASHLKNRIATLNPKAIARARKQWAAISKQIQAMGGAAAVQGQQWIQEQAMLAGESATESALEKAKPWLIAGGIGLAGAAILMIARRK